MKGSMDMAASSTICLTGMRRPGRRSDSGSRLEVVGVDDGPQQGAYILAGPPEPLVASVLGATGLVEPLRVSGAQGRVEVCVSDYLGDDAAQHALGDVDDHVTIVAGVG